MNATTVEVYSFRAAHGQTTVRQTFSIWLTRAEFNETKKEVQDGCGFTCNAEQTGNYSLYVRSGDWAVRFYCKEAL